MQDVEKNELEDRSKYVDKRIYYDWELCNAEMVIINDTKMLRINMFTMVGIKILTKHVLKKAQCQRVQQLCTSIQINNKKN